MRRTSSPLTTDQAAWPAFSKVGREMVSALKPSSSSPSISPKINWDSSLSRRTAAMTPLAVISADSMVPASPNDPETGSAALPETCMILPSWSAYSGATEFEATRGLYSAKSSVVMVSRFSTKGAPWAVTVYGCWSRACESVETNSAAKRRRSSGDIFCIPAKVYSPSSMPRKAASSGTTEVVAGARRDDGPSSSKVISCASREFWLPKSQRRSVTNTLGLAVEVDRQGLEMITQFSAFKDHTIGQVCNAPFAVDLFHADSGFIAGVFGHITASGGQRANDATANGKCTLVTRGGVLRGELNDIYNAPGFFWVPALRSFRR